MPTGPARAGVAMGGAEAVLPGGPFSEGCGSAGAMPDGTPTGHPAQAMSGGVEPGPCGGAAEPAEHHKAPFCSLCLLVRAAVHLSGPILPPRALVAHAIPWIGPASLVSPETHPCAPPARGPPALVC